MCRYTPETIAAAVDLAALKPNHTSVEVSICCQKAIRYNCASVCVQPYQMPIAARLLKGYSPGVGTVVSFPHGSDAPSIKARACGSAIRYGANELDMVLNIAAIQEGDWDTIGEEIYGAVSVCHNNGVILKVILETCYLKDRFIGYACQLAAKLGVDFVKTSTGFGSGNATPEAVRIMVDAVEGRCEVKASGGIKTYADAELYLDLGCTRLGSSRIEELMPYELGGSGE